jgi:hypothetical protein
MSYRHGVSPTAPSRPDHVTTAAPPAVRRSPPALVLMVTTAQVIAGAIALLAGGMGVLAAFGGTTYADRVSLPAGINAALLGLGGPAAAALALTGLAAIGLARKLQRGHLWAWLVMMGLSSAALGATFYAGIIRDRPVNVLLGLVAPVLCLVALSTSTARSWFARR